MGGGEEEEERDVMKVLGYTSTRSWTVDSSGGGGVVPHQTYQCIHGLHSVTSDLFLLILYVHYHTLLFDFIFCKKKGICNKKKINK